MPVRSVVICHHLSDPFRRHAGRGFQNRGMIEGKMKCGHLVGADGASCNKLALDAVWRRWLDLEAHVL